MRKKKNIFKLNALDRNSHTNAHIYLNERTVMNNMAACRDNIDERCIRFGEYICEKRATVRQTAAVFGMSKSTVHKDVSYRLKQISPQLWSQTKKILDGNKAERHIRGGMATKEKYKKIKSTRTP